MRREEGATSPGFPDTRNELMPSVGGLPRTSRPSVDEISVSVTSSRWIANRKQCRRRPASNIDVLMI